MRHPLLKGASILVVEDEPLIFMHVASAFEDAGAMVTVASSVEDARRFIDCDGLSAAVVDHGLGQENSRSLYDLLKRREIPFVIYTGHEARDCECEGAIVISKPASEETLVSAVERSLSPTSRLRCAHQPGLLRWHEGQMLPMR